MALGLFFRRVHNYFFQHDAMSESSEYEEVSSVSSAADDNNGDESVAPVVAPDHASNNVPPVVNADGAAEDGDVLHEVAPPAPGRAVAARGRGGPGREGRGPGRGRGRDGRRGRGVGSGRFRQGEGGRQAGRSNYSNNELIHMLEFVRDILPISGAEWDLVASRHAAFHPELGRTGDQLKKKFNKLCRTMIPTGNPNIPFSVREAKEIRQLIVEKTEGATGSEEELFSPNDVVEEVDGLAEEEELADENEVGLGGRSVAEASTEVIFDSVYLFVD